MPACALALLAAETLEYSPPHERARKLQSTFILEYSCILLFNPETRIQL